MSFVRAFVRWGCCMATIATLTVPAFSADKKPKETAATPEATTPSYYGPQPATENIDLTMYARIREEGFQHSHVMEFGDALANGIGPRLTGSPNMAKANEWTRDTLTEDRSGERAPRGLGRVRHGLAADQHLGADGLA